MAQWPVLRRHVRTAGWWIAVSAAGYAAGDAGAVAAVMTMRGDWLSDEALLVALHTVPNASGGLVCGPVTGLWLARHVNGARDVQDDAIRRAAAPAAP